MQTNDPSKYDFLLNPDKGQTRAAPTFDTRRKQIIAGTVFVVGVLTVVAIVVSLLFSSGGGNNEPLINLGSYQTEIERVIGVGQKNISDPEVKKQLGAYQTAILSDKNQLQSLLTQRGAEVTAQQLAVRRNSANDTALTDALVTDTHDQVLQSILQTLTNQYYADLRTASANASTTTEKRIIDTAIANVETVYATPAAAQ